MALADIVGNDVTFRTRLFGFDRQEVRSFIANLLEDLERARTGATEGEHEGPAAETMTRTSDTTSRAVQKVLESAHRVADDIERSATDASVRVVDEARARAEDVLAAAERRAAEITDEARRELNRLERSAAAIREQCVRLRSTFEAAADTASVALGEIAAISAETGLPAGELTHAGAGTAAAAGR
jgi:cell division septum initiation protein DivIVA